MPVRLHGQATSRRTNYCFLGFLSTVLNDQSDRTAGRQLPSRSIQRLRAGSGPAASLSQTREADGPLFVVGSCRYRRIGQLNSVGGADGAESCLHFGQRLAGRGKSASLSRARRSANRRFNAAASDRQEPGCIKRRLLAGSMRWSKHSGSVYLTGRWIHLELGWRGPAPTCRSL